MSRYFTKPVVTVQEPLACMLRDITPTYNIGG